jgi:hypothetical protein
MPLVQGPATVAKVEALLEAATGLDRKEALDVVVRPSVNFSTNIPFKPLAGTTPAAEREDGARSQGFYLGPSSGTKRRKCSRHRKTNRQSDCQSIVDGE